MYELIKLAENDYYVDCPAKIGIVRVGGDEVVLIDSGNDRDAGKKVLRILEANGWKLRTIYNTHSHADHIGGNRFLQERTGCAVYANGIEAAYTRYPILEPTGLYGGLPLGGLRHKFLMAQPSDASELTEATLPDGMKLLPLPGHSPDMVGFLTPDGTAYIADCVSSAETLEKYGIGYTWDPDTAKKTLGYVKTLAAKRFVPSHAAVTEDIAALADKNIGAIDAVYCGNGNPLSDNKINGYNLWFFPNDAQVGKPIVVSDVKFVNDDKANTTYSHTQGKQPKITGEAVNFSGYKSTSPLEAADCEVTFEGDLIKILRKTDPNGKNDGTELYTDEVNATGKQFIEFWVDTIDASVVNGTSLGMRVFAPDASGGWTAADIMAANGTDYYYLVNGVWLKGNVAGSVISLPAGFAGYVRVDLKQLSANLPAYCGNGKDLLDFSKIKGVWLWCTPTAERVNKTVYINSIRFVNADNSPEVEEKKNADTSDAMLGVSVVCAVAVCGVVFTAKKRKK